MSREKVDFSALLGSAGILYRAAPRGSALEFMSAPVLDGFGVRASGLVGPGRLGEPSCSWHAPRRSCRQGLTLTFVGPEIEVRASRKRHKASWQPHAVTQLFRASCWQRIHKRARDEPPQRSLQGTASPRSQGSCVFFNFLVRR